MRYAHRKDIRLKGYDYSADGAYFVTICTKDKKCIFGEVCVGGGALAVPSVNLTDIGRLVEQHIKKVPGIDKYVIMPNHIHLILIKENSNRKLSADIGGLKSVVTRELGYSIWQRAYYDHIVRSQDEYIEICRYIENNPAKWTEDKLYVDD